MSKPASKSNVFQIILRVGGILLTLVLLVYVLKKQHLLSLAGWQAILATVANIPGWLLFTACVLMLISRLAVSGRWHVLLRATGAEITLWKSIQLTFAGLFASNFLPTTVGGDVVRLARALRYRCDSGSCVASLLIDRLVGMVGMVLTLPFVLPCVLKGGVAGAALGHAAMVGAVGVAPKKQGKFARILRKIGAALLQGIRKPKSLLQSLALTVVHMCCFFTIMYLLLCGMGDHPSYWAVAGLWSVVYFITLVPITMNGLGTQEVAITFFFHHFAAVSPPHAAALAVLMRLLTMLASLPGVVFLPALMPDVRAQAVTAEADGALA